MSEDPLLLLDQVIDAIEHRFPDPWDRWRAEQLRRLRRVRTAVAGRQSSTEDALQANAHLAQMLGSELFSRIADDPEVLDLVADEDDPWGSVGATA